MQKTGRVVIVHEAQLTSGITGRGGWMQGWRSGRSDGSHFDSFERIGTEKVGPSRLYSLLGHEDRTVTIYSGSKPNRVDHRWARYDRGLTAHTECRPSPKVNDPSHSEFFPSAHLYPGLGYKSPTKARNSRFRCGAFGYTRYDEQGRLAQIRYADGTHTRNVFDGEGRTVASVDQLGRITRTTYDPAGRLLTTTYPAPTD